MVIGEIQNSSLLLPLSSLPLSPYPKCSARYSYHHCHRSLFSTPQRCPTSMNVLHCYSLTPLSPPSATLDHSELESSSGGISGNGGNRSWNRNGHGSFQWWWWCWWEDTPYTFEPDDRHNHWGNSPPTLLACLCSAYLALSSPEALASSTGTPSTIWEVRGGEWTRFLSDSSHDSFVPVGSEQNSSTSSFSLRSSCIGFEVFWQRCRNLFFRLMLPEGYPGSVSRDYLEYSLWRAAQGIASQISGVLSTQALLYAVGLGKGAIPTAAAVNWVLKDGIGYLSKILLSKYGRHFDVNPKGWRLFADLLENAAYGMEIMTPAFPQFFVFIGAVAGAGRSAASLIQAATRSCFYAGFAVNRNFAEVIAKGEAQGMVSKFLGIILGIALSNCIGLSTPFALASFGAVTALHMYCNLKSYQSIQLRTLNTYRASLVFSEYLWSGLIPSIKEVNDEEPLFTNLPYAKINIYRAQSQILSIEAKYAAGEICSRLELGSKLSEVVNSKEDAFALFDLFRHERYLLVEEQQKFHVILKEDSSLEDMLKSLFHVNYLFWLERNVGIAPRSIVDECMPGGRLQISLDYVQREFIHIKHDGSQYGWLTDGLIARPSSNRIRQGYDSTS